MKNEFDFFVTLDYLLKKWWIILGLAIIAGLVGLSVSYMLPPKYQAEAIFHSSIDFTEINFENLADTNKKPYIFTQHDEDLALQVVQRMMLATMDKTYDFALTLDSSLDRETFDRNYQIQRYHAQWYLRYRHEDPETAQSIVNFWADKTLKAFYLAQESGRVESFVLADLVSDANLPQVPQYHNRNTLVLAGAAIGLLAGIILVDLKGRYFTTSKLEV